MGRQDADPLVSHLPAVAVRAVQHAAAPLLPDPGDVGQFIGHPYRDEQRPGGQHRPVAQDHVETVPGRAGVNDLAADDLAVVSHDLVTSPREKL